MQNANQPHTNRKPRHVYKSCILALICAFFANLALAACLNPDGIEGDVVYNATYNVPQYCNGSDWMAFGAMNPAAGGSGCTSPTGIEADIVYNNSYHVLQYCDGDDWRAVGCEAAASAAGCEIDFGSNSGDENDTWGSGHALMGDGTYLYVVQSAPTTRIKPFAYNAGVWNTSLPAQNLTGGDGRSLWVGPNSSGTGSYIYASAGSTIQAFTFNGTAWTALASLTLAQPINNIWGDGTYLYVSEGSAGIAALTFDGTNWANLGVYNSAGTALAAWGDGTYIYLADDSRIRALTWNGTAWTHRGSSAAYWSEDVWGDGTYIYTTAYGQELVAYTFNGSAFTVAAHEYIGSNPLHGRLWVHNNYIYVMSDGGDLVVKFNGTSFSLENILPVNSYVSGRWAQNGTMFTSTAFTSLVAWPECN